MNKKSVIVLAVVAVILHFTPFFPNVAFYSRLLGYAFGYAWDTSVWITYLSIIGPLLFGAFMFHKIDQIRNKGEKERPRSQWPRNFSQWTLYPALFLIGFFLVAFVSNALHRRAIVRYFNARQIEAKYQEDSRIFRTGSWSIKLKSADALEETMKKIALLSKFTLIGDLWFIEDHTHVIPDALGDIADLYSLTIACDSVETLPGTIGNLSRLRSLNLSVPKLRKLPASVVRLKNLRQLSLWNCESLAALPHGLEQLSRLERLSVLKTTLN